MNVSPLLLCLPILLLAACVLIPSFWANAHVVGFRRTVTGLAGCQFGLCVATALVGLAGIPLEWRWTWLDLSNNGSVALAVHFDNLALMMLTLVSFVGWVISQYSIRYLDGEAAQGRYFKWTAFALGSVSLMVVSANLLLFMLAWVMTSTGLHKLLLHYKHRPAARRAAWTKFAISRIGDVALIIAIVLIYAEFRTLDFTQLQEATELLSASEPTSAMLSVAVFLLVIGAITKSAQVPFHTWLPLTMETPTPVSALMHAGIVNAGGYLMIRTSPLLAQQPWAMSMLVVFGGFTACFAAVVMTTQTSVKKKLAYSTIAQMGFMLLQCGLGAFSAAMLHILAHSLYKAHAFLYSGSVMQQRAATNGAAELAEPKRIYTVAAVGIVNGMILVGAFLLFGMNPMLKPGGLLLGGVLCLALTYWVSQVMRSGRWQLLVGAAGISAGLSLFYVASFYALEKLLAGSVPSQSSPALGGLLTALLLLAFGALLGLQLQWTSARRPTWLAVWYVHAANGFYLENHLRRMFGRFSL